MNDATWRACAATSGLLFQRCPFQLGNPPILVLLACIVPRWWDKRLPAVALCGTLGRPSRAYMRANIILAARFFENPTDISRKMSILVVVGVSDKAGGIFWVPEATYQSMTAAPLADVSAQGSVVRARRDALVDRSVAQPVAFVDPALGLARSGRVDIHMYIYIDAGACQGSAK